jgi:hypothetical protein
MAIAELSFRGDFLIFSRSADALFPAGLHNRR